MKHPLRLVSLLAAFPAFATAQEYWTNITPGTYDLSAATNWEDANALLATASDLRFFTNAANQDLALGGAYTINNDLVGLVLSNLTLEGNSTAAGRSVTLAGNALSLAAGGTITLGNSASSGGNAFGYTVSAPVTLQGGITLLGSPSNPGTVTFSNVTLPTSAAEFVSNSANRVSLNGGTLAADLVFSGTGTGGFSLGGNVTLAGNRVITVNGSSTPTLGGTISDGDSSFSITKEGTGLLTLAGANHTFDGGVIVNAGTLALTAGAGSLNVVPGGITVNNGAAVRLDWSGTPSAPSIASGMAFASGGTFEFGASNGNPVTVTQAGAVTGSGPLVILARNGKDSIVFSGDNSAYAGAVVIRSATPYSPTNRQGVGFSGPDALFGADGTPDITVVDGGQVRFAEAVSAAALAPFTFGTHGGIFLTGSAGGFDASVTNPFGLLASGGAIVLDSRDAASSTRWGDSVPVNLSGQVLQVVGRNANDSPISEIVGAMTVTGGSQVFLSRTNSDSTAPGSGVRLTAASLAVTPGAGNTLLVQTATANDFGDPATAGVNALEVSGVKPAVTNGMITPAVQHYAGGNFQGDFLTFSGDNLVRATYVTGFDGTATEIANLTANTTLTANETAHAVRVGASGGSALNLGGFTLSIASGGLLTTSSTISNGVLDFGAVPATLGVYNASSQATISAKVSGSAGVTVFGTSQTLNLTNTSNDFTGGLFVNGGAVSVLNNAINGNDVNVGPFGRLVAGAATNSSGTVGGVSGTGILSAWVAGSGTSTSTANLNPSSGTHVFAGLVSNGSSGRTLAVSKGGEGTQVFSGTGTYTGATTITAGTLRIDGDFSQATGAVSVNGGRLEGSGKLGGATTVGAAGTLSPGGLTTGILSFGGSLTLGGTTHFTLDGATRGLLHDAINVAGQLTYGGVLNLDFGPGPSGDVTLNLFDAGSTAGTFTAINLFGTTTGVLDASNNFSLQVGDRLWSFDHATGDFAIAVPEPSAFAALGLGLGGWLLLRRRRR